MSLVNSEDRVHSTCQACGVTDDHPRHHSYYAITHPATDEVIDLSVSRHIDCCAAAGCDVCKTDLEFTDNKKGLELADYLLNKSDEHHKALFDRHGIESPNHSKEAS